MLRPPILLPPAAAALLSLSSRRLTSNTLILCWSAADWPCRLASITMISLDLPALSFLLLLPLSSSSPSPSKSPKGYLVWRALMLPSATTFFSVGVLSKMAVSLEDDNKRFWTPLLLWLSEDVSLSEDGGSGRGEQPWTGRGDSFRPSPLVRGCFWMSPSLVACLSTCCCCSSSSFFLFSSSHRYRSLNNINKRLNC